MLPHTRLNRSLRILIVTNSALVFLVSLFAPFYAIYIVNLGGDIAMAGFSWALYMMVTGVLIFLFANWELKIKEPELLVALGYVLRAVVFLSYAFMGSIMQLLITQILWGIASAISAPAFDSVYAAHTTSEDSIAQWSGLEGIMAIMTGLGALLGGLVIEGFGYHTVFASMAVISLSLGIYVWMLPSEVL